MSVATPGLPRTARLRRRSDRKYAADPPVELRGGLRNVELYAKAEWKNPGGSVKDRPAARMIADGERSGALTRDKIMLDATSGNTGIAYAMIGAARGYRVRLCVPENVTPERKRILQGVRRRDGLHRSDGGIRRRDHPRQGRCTRRTRTSTSIRTSTTTRATGARTTTPRRPRSSSRPAAASRISSPGSARAGRSSASGRRLREFNPSIRLISVQPDSPLHGLEGLKHMETAIVPGIYDRGAGRRGPRRQHRGGVRADPAAGAGGTVRRHLERRQSGRRAARGAADVRTR